MGACTSRSPDFAQTHGPWALLLGASEGLGAALADELASRGLNLVLVARRAPKLESFAAALRGRHPDREVMTLALDLGHADAIDVLSRETAGLDVGLAVFNAAASHIGPFADASPADTQKIVDVNVAGVARFCHAVVPRLVARGRGGLLLMSSVSSFRGHALAASYAASKAFITALGEGLWAELEPRGVTVRVCAAGAISTPSFLDVTPQEGRLASMPMTPEAVARAAVRGLEKGSGPLVVPGAGPRFVEVLLRRVLSRTDGVRFMSANVRRVYKSRGFERYDDDKGDRV